MSKQSLQERLNDCKQFLLDESRSAKPSPLYIADLKETIEWLEIKIIKLQLHGLAPFEMVK